MLFLSDNGGCAEEPGGRDPKVRRPGPVDDYVAVGPAWGWAQNTPFRRYKSWVHEGGISTPLIVRWPGQIAPGGITRQVGHIIDIMPTLCDLAGVHIPRDLQRAEDPPGRRAESVAGLPWRTTQTAGSAGLGVVGESGLTAGPLESRLG